MDEQQQKSLFGISKTGLIIILILGFFSVFSLIGYLYYLNNSMPTTAKTEKVETELANLRFGTDYDFARKDVGPTKNYDDFLNIFRSVYGTLASYTQNGSLAPSLATNWTNPDDTTWRFFLRKNVKFSNGKPLAAEDVKFTFDTIRADQESQFNEYFSEITAVNVVNPDVVEFKTEKPAPYLISKMAFLFIIPKDTKDLTFSGAPGTGPYVYNKTESAEGKQLVLDRNDLYWGKKPKVKRVTTMSFDKEQDKIKAFKDGNLDMIDVRDQENLAEAQNIPNITHETMGDNGVTYLILNMGDEAKKYISTPANPLNDKKVRQAMWEAINTDDMISTSLKGVAIPASQVVSRQTFGFDPKIKRPDYNLTDAKKLMKEAGYEQGFKITLAVTDDRQKLADYVKKAMKDINIEVTYDMIPSSRGSDHIKRLMKHDFAVGAVSWTEDSRDGQNTLLTLFTGSSEQNMGSFKNADLDKTMVDLAGTTDQKERQKLIQKGLKIVRDEIPVVPLYTRNFNWFTRDKIKWQPDPTSEYDFAEASGLTEEKVAEKKSSIFDFLKFW